MGCSGCLQVVVGHLFGLEHDGHELCTTVSICVHGLAHGLAKVGLYECPWAVWRLCMSLGAQLAMYGREFPIYLSSSAGVPDLASDLGVSEGHFAVVSGSL